MVVFEKASGIRDMPSECDHEHRELALAILHLNEPHHKNLLVRCLCPLNLTLFQHVATVKVEVLRGCSISTTQIELLRIGK